MSAQRVLSEQLASRRFLLRPPEPSSDLLVSSPSSSVYIGKTAFLRVPFFWNPSKLVNPHICAVGMTGSGKSYFVKTFITRARLTLGCGFVILDWAGEYSDWVRAAGGTVISFGKDGLNLLELAGASPHARIAQVMQALEMLTDLQAFPGQKSVTADALERAYLANRFSLDHAGQKRRPPTLQEVAAILARRYKNNHDATESGRRIRRLLASSGNSFSKSSLDLGRLVSSELVCIDLHSLPTENLRSLAGLAILQFIKEKMRSQEFTDSRKIRLFVVVDEAWKIAADERSDVVSIVREGRKYGFGLIVASHNPTDVHKSIFSCAGPVVCFRLTLASERDYVRSSLAYSEFFERQSHNLSVGQAIFHLEFSTPVTCPKTFVLGKVDGEALLQMLNIRGDFMELSFEKGDLARKLLAFGISDKQANKIIVEFERCNYSLEAKNFILLMEHCGQSRASILSFMRGLGATEKGLLCAFSAASQSDSPRVSIALAPARAKNPPLNTKFHTWHGKKVIECQTCIKRNQKRSRMKSRSVSPRFRAIPTSLALVLMKCAFPRTACLCENRKAAGSSAPPRFFSKPAFLLASCAFHSGCHMVRMSALADFSQPLNSCACYCFSGMQKPMYAALLK
ncbi:MAG: ATP-binding protein [Candidatus Micrarchaeota archaeon]|nr:ATP-binding protein [Candidatus Micrarchaeota archaeon]